MMEPMRKVKISPYNLKGITPYNIKSQKKKFDQLNGNYNPTFNYTEFNPKDYEQQNAEPDKKYFKIAKKIIEKTIRLFGSRSNYIRQSEGEVLTKQQIRRKFNIYIARLDNSDLDVWMIFKKDRIARSSMITSRSSKNGKYEGKLMVAEPVSYRKHGIEGVFNHEIGTHYLRKYNQEQ